jgi:hypothetical protein
MTTEAVTGEAFMKWGKLVKTWATGRSYFEDETPPITIDKLPVPNSIQELRTQMALVGAGALIPPANIVGLAIIQYTADTMVVRLPPKERIEAMEATLEQPGATPYNFPDFYGDFINRPLNVQERLDVHACRIGDYTMSHCG